MILTIRSIELVESVIDDPYLNEQIKLTNDKDQLNPQFLVKIFFDDPYGATQFELLSKEFTSYYWYRITSPAGTPWRLGEIGLSELQLELINKMCTYASSGYKWWK